MHLEPSVLTEPLKNVCENMITHVHRAEHLVVSTFVVLTALDTGPVSRACM